MTARRTPCRSASLCGWFTISNQVGGRSTGHSLSSAWNSSVPCSRRHKLDHRHCSASSNQLSPQGVALDITTNGEEVLIRLDRKRLEPPLVEMASARRMAMGVPAHRMRMRKREPAQECRQLPIFPRP